jgi:murein L,D-transpeptidase YcbB/YkuD
MVMTKTPLLSLRFISLILGSLVFFSCQKNLIQISTTSIKAPDTTKVVIGPGKSISFDALYCSNHMQPTLIAKRDEHLSTRITKQINEFYKADNYQTKWLTENMPGYLFNELRLVINNASHYGLETEDYGIHSIENKITSLYADSILTKEALVDLDIEISEMLFLFAAHLHEGKIKNAPNGRGIWIREEKEVDTDYVTMLLNINSPTELNALVTELQPLNQQYGQLQKVLDQYRALEKSNKSLTLIVTKDKIKPDSKHPVIPAVRKRLFLTDLNESTYLNDTTFTDSLTYDQPLALAVKRFQARHGLEADGIIGEKTVKFLNQSIKEKADIIALNMERIKWAPSNNGDNYVIVNIPEYKLRLYQDKKPIYEMNVIVGAVDKPTPVFQDALEYLVFSPTWTVPHSILKDEMIPHLKKDSLYYAEKNYSFYKNEVSIDPSTESWDSEAVNPYQYKVVQQPGKDNALGLVKFIMPNHMNVYLHDTPNHSLFSKNFRALSHGCIRLSEPAKFAELLLSYQKGWNKETIIKAMNGNTPYTLLLKKHCAVQIEYRTAWIDENGQINFREDIYEHDKNQLDQLRKIQKAPSMAGL